MGEWPKWPLNKEQDKRVRSLKKRVQIKADLISYEEHLVFLRVVGNNGRVFSKENVVKLIYV